MKIKLNCRPERFKSEEYPLPSKICSPDCRYWPYCNEERLNRVEDEITEEREELRNRVMNWKNNRGAAEA